MINAVALTFEMNKVLILVYFLFSVPGREQAATLQHQSQVPTITKRHHVWW